MNILTFRKEVYKMYDDLKQFELFRTGAENYYKLYCKNREKEYAEKEQEYVDPEKFAGSEDEELFLNDWAYISLSDITELYSQLGVKIEDELQAPLRQNIDGELYYPEDFNNAYRLVQSQKEDIDFCYGLLCLIAKVPERQKIYEEFVKNVKKLLKEHGLEECERMLGNIKKVFIAMWFDDSMKKARGQIGAAIKSCGYEPMIINDKEHNNQIVPEILKEIEDSEFVVADLTGQRGGVYFEAGYAVAKNKELILCCEKEEEKDIHFDVKQINTILWKNEQELKEKLAKRIKATVGICE